MSGVSYRWVMLLLAAAAMVGTLPGRTQGLGLVTEPLIADLRIGRVDYAQLNLWATLDRIASSRSASAASSIASARASCSPPSPPRSASSCAR